MTKDNSNSADRSEATEAYEAPTVVPLSVTEEVSAYFGYVS